MGKGLRIGSIRGIEIALDWSLLVIFLLVAVSLAAGALPLWHPDWGAGLVWAVALVSAALLIVSVLVHELSHALVGRALGVKIHRITLFVFGGMAQLEREPQVWKAEFWMALVGPITSLAIGVACLMAGGALVGPADVDPDDPAATMAGLGPVATILLWLGPINIILGLFNLVPGFPLDGGRVLRAVIWGATGDVYRATRWAAGLGRAFGLLLMAAGFAMILGLTVPIFGRGVIGGVWIALIGWFLQNAALLSHRQLVAQRSLEGVPVSRLMLAEPATVPPEMPVNTLVDDFLMHRDQRSFPVVEGGQLVGLVRFEDVRKVEPGARAERRVSDIMTPVRELATVAPDVAAADALQTISQREVEQLPVVSEGRVHGLLRREDILKWLALRGDWEVPA